MGQGTWDLTNFYKRRIYSAKNWSWKFGRANLPVSQNRVRGAKHGVQLLKAENFFGNAGALPSRKTIRRSPFTTRYSPFATRCRFWLGRSIDIPFSRPSSHAPRPVLSRLSGSASRTKVRSIG